MASLRFWCSTCAERRVGSMADACHAVDHKMTLIGFDETVAVCVTDRRLDLDAKKHGFLNMVGHANGRSVAEQEAYTRQQIEDLRKRAAQQKRERRINAKVRDNPYVSGAIPSALLFSLRRQYGHDYLQKAKELMKRENLWFGE